jgi:hypothetical protein
MAEEILEITLPSTSPTYPDLYVPKKFYLDAMFLCSVI